MFSQFRLFLAHILFCFIQLSQLFLFFFLCTSISHLCSLLFLLAIYHLSLLLLAFSLLLFISPSFIYLSNCLFTRLNLQELPEKWTNVKKQAVLVKQQVAPLQAIEVASLRRKCASFDVEQHTFREHFRNNGPFR